MSMGKGGNVKASGKLFIALLCVLIACVAWSPAVLAAPAVAKVAADPAIVAEIGPLSTNRTIQQIADDPVVKAALQAAWEDSNAGNKTTRHEEGGWILEGEDGNITIIRWASGNRSSIDPGPTPPAPPGGRVVGHFHTHPNPPTDEDSTKWEQGPSEADKNFANARGLPGIVVNAAGNQFFGPGS
jgi:hypothetical protein